MGNQVIGGTVDNDCVAVIHGLADELADKMETVVEMLGTCMESSAAGRHDSRSIVIEESCRLAGKVRREVSEARADFWKRE